MYVKCKVTSIVDYSFVLSSKSGLKVISCHSFFYEKSKRFSPGKFVRFIQNKIRQFDFFYKL